MKKIILFTAALLAFCHTSCSKQDAEAIEPKEMASTVVQAVISNNPVNGTKTIPYDDGKTPMFCIGDRIWFSDACNTADGKVISIEEENDRHIANIEISYEKGKFNIGGTIYGIYPYEAAVGVNDGNIRFKIPSMQDGSFDKANICAVKGNARDLLYFRNTTALLMFSSKHKLMKKFVVSNPDFNIAGEYEFSYENLTTCAADSPSVEPSRTIEVENLGDKGPYYITVAPDVTFSEGEAVVYYSAKGTRLGKRRLKSPLSIERSGLYRLGDALSEYFSVSEERLVSFARGNMWYGRLDGASEASWNFEESQTATVPVETVFPIITPTWHEWDPNHVSHFYYNSLENMDKSYLQFYTKEATLSADAIFFTNDQSNKTKPNADFIVGGEKGIWRVLSKEETIYLMSTRKVNGGQGTSNSCHIANVDGVPGLLIFPDDYKDKLEEYTSIPDMCAFLPVTGWRQGNAVCNVYYTAHYITSSGASGPPNNYAFYALLFGAGGISESSDTYMLQSWRNNGAASVRLVRDVE